jgi:hypothetical protein
MIEQYARLWHGGRVPTTHQARVEFIAHILEVFLPDGDRLITNIFTVEEWYDYKKEAALALAEAADIVARAQAAPWKH